MRMVKTPTWPADRFKAFIDRILDETGLNKAQLAALVGINPSQISRWTNGSTRPRFDTLAALGQALQERFPRLDAGPLAILAAAGYSTDPQELQESEPTPLADHQIENPTPREAAMLDILASLQEEVRALNEKVDDLSRDRERDQRDDVSREQKGA